MIGQPSNPNRSLARSLGEILTPFSEIREAHFPQCFAPGKMARPAQVLMVVFSEEQGIDETVMAALREAAARLVPTGDSLDIWPMTPTSVVLASVRSARCRILSRAPSGKALTEDPWSLWGRLLRLIGR